MPRRISPTTQLLSTTLLKLVVNNVSLSRYQRTVPMSRACGHELAPYPSKPSTKYIRVSSNRPEDWSIRLFALVGYKMYFMLAAELDSIQRCVMVYFWSRMTPHFWVGNDNPTN